MTEIIKCKDCRFWKECNLPGLDKAGLRLGRCEYIKHKTTADDFCCWAEKKAKK